MTRKRGPRQIYDYDIREDLHGVRRLFRGPSGSQGNGFTNLCVLSQGEIGHGLSALALHEFGKVANSKSLISYDSLVPRRIDLR